MTLSDSTVRSIGVNVSETLEFADAVVKTASIRISEDLTLSDSTTKSTTIGISEDLQFTDAVSKLAIVDVSESLILDDVVSKTVSVKLNQTLAFSDSTAKNTTIRMDETLVLSDEAGKSAIISIDESLGFTDSTTRIVETNLSETLVLSDSTSQSKAVTQSISESLILSDSVTDSKSINVAISESLILSDSVNVGLLSVKEISESIQLTDSLTKSTEKLIDESIILSDDKQVNSDTTVSLTESLPLTNEQLDSTSVGRIADSVSSLLGAVVDVKVFQIGSNYYAIAVGNDNALQIVDVTNPENPTTLGSISDNVTRLLETPKGVDVIQIGSSYYAVVASFGDDGIEIIDVTNVNSPSSVGRVSDDGTKLLDGASDVAIVNISDSYYAVVASYYDEGIEIIDISNPASPNPVARVADDGNRELSGAQNVVIYQQEDKLLCNHFRFNR